MGGFRRADFLSNCNPLKELFVAPSSKLMIETGFPVTLAPPPGMCRQRDLPVGAVDWNADTTAISRVGCTLRRAACSLLAAAFVLLIALPSGAQQPTEFGSAEGSPFVGAFERLGRHQEIDAQLAGRLLITELNCTACHLSDDPSLLPKRGPDLSAAGNRFSSDWIERFVANPSAIKPGTTMPNVLHAHQQKDRSRIAASLSAYLSSLRRPLGEVRGTGLHPVPHQFWNLGDVDHGRTLFHRIGCVACHGPDPEHETVEMPASQTDQLLELLDPEELEELGLASAARSGPVQPLGSLDNQYSLRSLTLFLLDPEATRPGGRMPNFKLAAVDAADIATYLLRRSADRPATADFTTTDSSSSPESPDPMIAEGRELFVQLRCVNCHQADVQTPKPTALALDRIDLTASSGCLAASSGASEVEATVAAPRFGVDADQAAAIRLALADGATLKKQQQLELKLLRLNCYACHQRDGLGGISRDRRAYFETVAHEDLGDEGRLPPPLSGVGRKAVPAWLNRVLQGNGDIRPHMHARMPKFPAAVARELAALLTQVDRASLNKSEPDQKVHRASWPAAEDEKQVEAGRSMMDAGCVQCHSFRGEALPGVVGIDLSGITDRVEPEWFREFLFDPGSVKQRTRMPSFFPDGKSQNAELLGGDADRQIAAMWGYLKTLSQQPLPAKIEEVRAKDFELKPTDRPILLRTFMRDAGTHAIAVGFPQQVHFAMDADSLRLASAWRGRFLDAQGTWFVRAAPPADPLGEDLISICDDDLFIFSTEDAMPTRRFLGFQLDDQGVPTFSYSVGDLEVEDRITPLDELTSSEQPSSDDPSQRIGLRRVLQVRYKPAGLPTAHRDLPTSIRVLSGRQLTTVDNRSVKNDRGLVVTLQESIARLAEQHTDRGVASWIVPLRYSRSSGSDEPRVRLGQADDDQAREDKVIRLEVGYQW